MVVITLFPPHTRKLYLPAALPEFRPYVSGEPSRPCRFGVEKKHSLYLALSCELQSLKLPTVLEGTHTLMFRFDIIPTLNRRGNVNLAIPLRLPPFSHAEAASPGKDPARNTLPPSVPEQTLGPKSEQQIRHQETVTSLGPADPPPPPTKPQLYTPPLLHISANRSVHVPSHTSRPPM